MACDVSRLTIVSTHTHTHDDDDDDDDDKNAEICSARRTDDARCDAEGRALAF